MRLVLSASLALLSACKSAPDRAPPATQEPRHVATPVMRADEPHLASIVQLTFGGENAEAYWNADGSALIFQSTRGDSKCDQIFRMNADGSDVRQLSSGKGRTTCAYFQNDGTILYASTEAHGEGCMWTPDHSQGYVWPLYPEMDLWQAGPQGENARLLFQSKGYDAEATVCRKDGRVIFTSTMDGDPEIYVIDRDGSNLRRLTHTPGYDGGAFFSPDCSKIVWRASRPEGAALEEFRALLAKSLVRPSKLEIYVMNADGSGVVQVTKNGAASFAPYMHSDGERLLYVSNKNDPKGRNFDIFLVRTDGGGDEQITFDPSFDGFPMWSPDGKRLAFASNRNNARHGDTNIFVASWID
jgi:Tol biopolymer transport system component